MASLAESSAPFAAGKATEEFRDYGEDGDRSSVVTSHYTLMRTHQTLDFAARMAAKYGKYDKCEMTVREAFGALEGYVDSSDPDTE